MIPLFKISRIRDSLKKNSLRSVRPFDVKGFGLQKIHHIEVRYWISGVKKRQVKTLVRIVHTAIQEMLKLMRARGETDIMLSDHPPSDNNVYLVLRSTKGFDPELLSIFLSYLYFEPVQDNFWFQFWKNKQRVIDLHRYDPKIALNPVPDDRPQRHIGNLFRILQDTLPLLDIPFQTGNNRNSYTYLFDALGDKEYRDATCDRIYIGFFRKRTSEQIKAFRSNFKKTAVVSPDKLIAFADVGDNAVRMYSAKGEEEHPLSKHIQRLTSY